MGRAVELMGAPAAHPEPVERAASACIAQRLPFVVFSDGDDMTAVFGQPGDTAEQVQAMAARCMPWGA